MQSAVEEMITNPDELSNILHRNPIEESGSNLSSLSLMQNNNSMFLFNGLHDPLTSASSGTGKWPLFIISLENYTLIAVSFPLDSFY